MRVFLVRHTEYYNPQNIYPFHLPLYLSEKGRRDAKTIALWLAERKMNGTPIYSSPIARCVQTAEIIASQTGSNVLIDEQIVETSCPNLQGVVKPEIDSWRLEEDDVSRETKQSVLARMRKVWEERLNDEKDYILASHGDQLTMLYYHIINREIPHYLWSPESEKNNVLKGDVVEVMVQRGKIESMEKIRVI